MKLRKQFQKSAKLWIGLITFLGFAAWGIVEFTRVRPPLRGELEFPAQRPVLVVSTAPSGKVARSSYFSKFKGWVSDRLGLQKVPSEKADFGDRFHELRRSNRPADEEELAKIERWADALEKRFLVRYPEFDVPYKAVPPEENGFLKWLEFSERYFEDPRAAMLTFNEPSFLSIPPELKSFLDDKGPWDSGAMATWRAGREPLLAELHEIGLSPNQSVAGIDVGRYYFLPGSVMMDSLDLLKLDARDRIEKGEVAEALQAIAAGRGLVEHFLRIENPTLLSATMGHLGLMQILHFAFEEIIPRVPKEQFFAGEWEKALSPNVPTPSDFAHLLQGEWFVMRNYWLLPMICDAEDPEYIRDPADLLDYLALNFLHYQKAFSGKAAKDWKGAVLPMPLEWKHLSKSSQELAAGVAFRDWYKGYKRLVAQFGIYQAAFVMMKGGAVPLDPFYGQRYEWDPATKTLGSPLTPEFEALFLAPIVVPHLP